MKSKILIVDDNPVVLSALAMQLLNHGYEVVTSTEPSTAFNQVRTLKPDLVLVDLNFPPDPTANWDGFNLVGWVRRLGETRHIPVIVISGDAPEKSRKRALDMGAVDFFQKPVRTQDLLRAVESALENRDLPRPEE
jgi:CheY-like chemotaxis protein